MEHASNILVFTCIDGEVGFCFASYVVLIKLAEFKSQGVVKKKENGADSLLWLTLLFRLQSSAEPETSPLGEKERSGEYLQHPGILLVCQRCWFLPHLNKDLDENNLVL